MKTNLLTLALAGALIVGSAFTMPGGIKVGDKAPMTDHEMKDVVGDTEVSLDKLAKKNGLLVIFSCNTCPFVLAWEDRYNDLARMADKYEIGIAVLNSNEAKRSDADSEDAMKEKADAEDYSFAYLVDTDSKIATAFGATVTPQAYLFDGEMSLVYTGLIDDNMRDRKKAEPYLMTSLEKLFKGETIDPAKTNAKGCSIKKR